MKRCRRCEKGLILAGDRHMIAVLMSAHHRHNLLLQSVRFRDQQMHYALEQNDSQGRPDCYFLPQTFSTSRQTASVTVLVSADPPISLVRVSGLPVTFSMASMKWSATASSSPLPSHLTISAADQKAPTGFATPLPAMSGAEPWIGSNMEGQERVGSRFEEGAMPIEPARAAARSERISAWTVQQTVSHTHVLIRDTSKDMGGLRLVATIVSRLSGLLTILTVMASTSILSCSTTPS